MAANRGCPSHKTRVVALPHRHPFRVQEERQMDVHVPGVETGDGKFSKWDFYIQCLCGQNYFMEQDPVPIPPVRCGI